MFEFTVTLFLPKDVFFLGPRKAVDRTHCEEIQRKLLNTNFVYLAATMGNYLGPIESLEFGNQNNNLRKSEWYLEFIQNNVDQCWSYFKKLNKCNFDLVSNMVEPIFDEALDINEFILIDFRDL